MTPTTPTTPTCCCPCTVPDSRRAGPGLRGRWFRTVAARGVPHARRPRSGAPFRPCALRPDAGPRVRLSRHGPDVAVVDHGAGASVPGADLFLALLRKAVE